VLVEEFDQLGKIGQRSGEAVNLVDHHDIDAPGRDIGQEPLQRRPLHRAAREAAIIVAISQATPALMGLALDVGFGRLTLVVEGVELLLQPMLGRDPGVDGAA